MSSVVIEDRLPAIIRLLGGKFRDGKRQYRMKWGELGVGHRGYAFDLINFGDEDGWSLHVHALWINAFIKLPLPEREVRCEDFSPSMSWGFSGGPEFGLHIHRGCKTKVITMPWRDWVQTDHDVRRDDGSWVPFVGSWEEKGREIRREDGTVVVEGKEPDGRQYETHPYRYVLRSGEVQNVTATISVERRRRKLRWLRWLPFARTTHAIDVSFDGEVGERSGSWKGGCVGCGYTLRPDETPRECLYRMQEERKF